MHRARRLRVVLLTIGFGSSIAVPEWARGQVVEVPPFTVATPAPDYEVMDGDVTVGPDGKLGFLWVEMESSSNYQSGKAFVRTVSPQGTTLGPVRRVDTTGWVNFDVSPTISPDGSGGYVAAWNILNRVYAGTYLVELYGMFLDREGIPIGSDFEVGPTAGAPEVGVVVGEVVVGLPSGAVFAWLEPPNVVGRLYDAARRPVGAPLALATMGSVSAPRYFDLDATRDGGFAILWSEVATAESWARAFDADGQPLGPPFLVASTAGSIMHRIAASPLGGFAVMGTRRVPGLQVWVRRFDATGGFLGDDAIAVVSAENVTGDLAFDDSGNLMVAWAEQPGTPVPPTGRARAYDASGAPLGSPMLIDSGAVWAPRVAPLSGGHFVIGWSSVTAVRASVLSLCTPGTAVCGDGTPVSQCEQCDDGAANSDVLPDACRTNCRRAHCGDGVLDTGEECDDGNVVDGDCCSWRCRLEPDFDGDGVCDPSDDCPLFPDPAQTDGATCEVVPLDGLSEEQDEAFEEGLEEFSEIETPETGLGPVFNGASCAECHHHPTIGGSSERFVTRFGRGGPGGAFDPMTEVGGSLIQAEGITTAECSVPGETVPPEATYMTARDTPPLFGLGLVDAIDDARLLRISDPTDRNHDGISGRPNMIGGRVGRFGWKAHIVTLAEFAAVAYRDEIGITNPALPDEVSPQGAPTTCDPVADPEDDGEDVAAFETFMRLLAPLSRGASSSETRLGRKAFKRARCHVCHTDKLRTGFSDVRLRTKRVRIFSDLLLHDMGPGLADGMVQGEAGGSEFRTAPLWGVRASAPYLHDGRAATIDAAIAAHDGEAAAARDRYLALTPAEKAALVAYLNSL